MFLFNVLLYQKSERIIVIDHFSVSRCIFSGIKNDFDGKAIFLNDPNDNLVIDSCIFNNISMTSSGDGVINYRGCNVSIKCLSFSSIRVNSGGAIVGACLNGSISICDVSKSNCITNACMQISDYCVINSINSSNNVASKWGDIRQYYVSQSTGNRFVHIDKASSTETLSISNTVLQYVILTNNNYGHSWEGGLIRLSYSSSVIEYASIFWNSGSYFVTFYQASCSISNCYTNEAQSQFSGCTLVSDFHGQCSTFTEYHSIQSTCPTHFDYSYTTIKGPYFSYMFLFIMT